MNVFFYLSSDVQYNVMVKINRISGLPLISSTDTDSYECYIEATLYSKGMILGLPICCSYKQFNSSSFEWNEWIKFGVRFCDISRDTQITFTLYKVSPITDQPNHNKYDYQKRANWSILKESIIGGVTLPLFENRILRFGRHKLRIKEGYKGDGSINSNTLFTKLNPELTVKDRLESVVTMKAMRQIPKVQWLDSITNRRLQKITGINKINKIINAEFDDDIDCTEEKINNDSNKNNGIYLEVDLPNLGFQVVYQEKAKGKKFINNQHQNNNNKMDIKMKNRNRRNNNYVDAQNKLFSLHDPEIRLNNPVLEKNNKLSKHSLFSTYDIRPSADEQSSLRRIIESFEIDINNLSYSDKNLLWKFRNFLIDDKYALTKFLRIINQSSSEEVNIASNLIKKWVPIDVANALELLSGHFVNDAFRKHGL